MNCSKFPVVTELEYMEPLCTVFEIRKHDDHLLSALGESPFDGLRHMNFVGPLLCSDGITVERIDNWVAAGFLLEIAGR